MVQYTGINHPAMVTADMDATIYYWRDLLEMPLVVGLGRPGNRQYFFSIAEKSMLVFFEWDGVEPLPEKDHGVPVKGPYIFDHLSIGVENDDDLYELRDRLNAAGYWVSEPVDHGFIHSIYSFDPNGIAVEFSCCIDGVDPLQYPHMVDTHPTQAAMEGSRPIAARKPGVSEPTPPEERFVYPGQAEEYFERKNHYDKK